MLIRTLILSFVFEIAKPLFLFLMNFLVRTMGTVSCGNIAVVGDLVQIKCSGSASGVGEEHLMVLTAFLFLSS